MKLSLRSIIVAVPVTLLHAAHAWAAFTFSPVRLDLKPNKSAVALTVNNTGDKSALMQLETSRWSQKGGVDVLEATEDLLAVPPVFSIPPHQTQTVRIAVLDRLPSDKEASYRIFLTELPQREEGEKSVAIGIAMRVSLPFFVKPESARQALEWNIKSVSPKQVALTLSNSGNVHTHIKKIAILSHSDRTPLMKEKEEVFYVLPEQARSWNFDLEKDATPTMVVVFEDVESGKKEVILKLNAVPGPETAPSMVPKESVSKKPVVKTPI